MLKIRDNTDLEELEKFRLDIGCYPLDDNGSKIYIDDYHIIVDIHCNDNSEECCKKAMELIYELTIAGLVEKE
jgi:hypothetical protein